MSEPTIGRIVYFNDEGKIRPAVVTEVWGPSCVNLEVFGLPESTRTQTSVTQDTSETPQHRTWDWMPYQKQQQAKEAGPEAKSLGATDVNGAKKLVSDLKTFGNGDMFALLCKASSEAQGWMKSTKAMEIPGAGCVVQVTTQQRNPDESYALAEAVCFVPGVYIGTTTDLRDPSIVIGRQLEVILPSGKSPTI